MLAYHNDPAVKAKYVARFAAHRAADEVVQGHPVLGGWAASRVDIALPIWVAGSMKIAYDVLLWRAFRNAKPPEERTA